MFDMKNVSRKIVLLRKQNNLTQMELADRLNVSFQAVSNWERGETMPDISKLPELAGIFNTSIDDILGNMKSSKIIGSIIEGRTTEYASENGITIDEFKDVAPLLKPNQLNELSKGITVVNDINDMIEYLPFVSRELADRIAQKVIESDMIMLDDIVPFVSKKYADELVLKALEKGYDFNSIIEAAPFVSGDMANRIADIAIEKDQIILDEILPFVSKSCADKIVLKAFERGYVSINLSEIIPFISEGLADRIVKKAIDGDRVNNKK